MSRRQRRRRSRRRAAAGAGLSLGAALGMGATAQAADYTVDDTGDLPLGNCTSAVPPNDCSLRDAIDLANADAAPDRILFQSGLSGTITIALFNPGFLISEPLEIIGPGAGALTVDGQNKRIFLANANTTISGLTLVNGNAYQGGAIASYAGSLIVADSVLTDNLASYASAPPTRGGAIYAGGDSLAVRNSTLSDNDVTGYNAPAGGAILATSLTTVEIDRTTISDNTAGTGSGGGIAAFGNGSVSVTDSTISGNEAGGSRTSDGGGIAAQNNGSFTIEASTVSGNTAIRDGGGIYAGSQPTTIRNSTISGNTAYYEGGGLSAINGAVELTNSTVASNMATGASFPGSYGGGVFLCNCTSAEIQNSILADNSAGDGADLYSSFGFGVEPQVGFTLIEGSLGNGGGIVETVPGSNKLGIDPQLNPLGSNGGQTETHSLPMPSPAVDAGSSFGATTDQRGSTRPFDIVSIPNSAAAGADGADMGAFELLGTNPATNPGTNPGPAANAPTCHGQRATVVAVADVKTKGTAGDDVILGTPGDDVVGGGGGNDVICLGDGDDSAGGGEGDDLLLGGKGSDKLKGGAGNDTIRGRLGDDRIRGGSGDDRAFGGLGNDDVAGGPGNDLLRGGDGDDVVNGEPEVDDKRHGGHGSDDRGGGKDGSKG